MKRHFEEGPGGMADPPFFQLLFWWVSRIVLTLCACFFVLFGIFILIASFYMKDPFLFIMSFLSSTLIILISAAPERLLSTIRSRCQQIPFVRLSPALVAQAPGFTFWFVVPRDVHGNRSAD